MADVYVMRHGETDCNRDGIIQGPRIDSELSDLGHSQAERLGDAFAETPLDALFVSPMLRARQTALALAEHAPKATAMQVVPELYEMDFGALCGTHIDDSRAVLDQVGDAWDMGFTDQAYPGGESPMLVQHRIRAFAHRLAASSGHIGIVAHGRVNRILLATLMGTPLQHSRQFSQSNAGITHLGLVAQPTVHRLNDVSHLT
jgi:broad specificity phosphatase PhoE